MTDLKTTNPFGDSLSASEPKTNDVTMRTLQDDLASLTNKSSQEKVQPVNNPKPPVIPPTINKIQPVPQVPIPPRTTNPASPQQQSPFNASSPTKIPPQVAQTNISNQAKQTIPIKTTSFQPNVPKLVEIPTAKKTTTNPDTLYKIVFSGIVFIIIAILGFGYYYYSRLTISTSNEQAEQITPGISDEISNQNNSSSEPVIIEPTNEKYSTVNPNFLQIDSSTASTDDIKLKLTDIANEIKEYSSSAVYEFTVVDTNNNPIAFQVFAAAAKLKFSPAVFDKLGQDFSLFLYNNSGVVRLGLKIKNKSNSASVLSGVIIKQEPTLVSDIAFVFLGAPIEKKKNAFTTNTDLYTNTTSRYLNVNSDNTLSIDYLTTDADLFIGTSKETLRKIYLQANPATPQTIEVEKENNPSTNNNTQTIITTEASQQPTN